MLKIPFYKKQKPFLFSILGYLPVSKVYTKALIHKSINEKYNNERLEFLGDAVLSFIIADLLFLENKNKEEGFLSQKRAMIVSRKHLNLVGKKIIPKNQIESRLKKLPINIYGNTLEAIIGAIYVDKGIEQARQFIKRYIYDSDFLDLLMGLDFKGILSKHSQKENGKIEYKKEKYSGNEKTVSVTLFYNGKEIIKSKGYSKKEAEQKAAQKGIKILF